VSLIRSVGLPPDRIAWSAVVLGVLWLVTVTRVAPEAAERWVRRYERRCVAGLSAAAAALSWLWIHAYLMGGPRIVDATSYFLQGRALAAGHLVVPTPEPSGAFAGRFLLRAADQGLSGIFPPGYPALLAVGHWLGAPLSVGPVLAAALVWATWALGRRLFDDPRVGLLAASISTLCAALRYHTADTMSHAWSTLLGVIVLLALLRRSTRGALLAGFCGGWLLATRPVSALFLGLALGSWLVVERRWRHLLWVALAALPGLGLLVAHQWLATGSPWGSTQLAYYAVADGPPGCFRYGFGRGIGCLVEHGDFVRAGMPEGLGPWQVLAGAGRRLRLHLLDLANFEPLALLVVLAPRWLEPRRAWPLLGLAALPLVAYAPFYFDGSYPGGGARMLVEALPVEHVLLAAVALHLRWARWVPPLMLAGFGFHASFEHRALSEREGGRPMFEAQVLRAAGVDAGLVLLDTDHGFSLAFAPGVMDAHRHVVAARLRGDAHDRLLWENLGRPATWRYHFDPWHPNATPWLEPWVPVASPHWELEAEWPPLAVSGGWLSPAWGIPCAGDGRGLSLHPSGAEPLLVTLGLPPSAVRGAPLLQFAVTDPGERHLNVTWGDYRGELQLGLADLGCHTLPLEVQVGAGRPGRLQVTLTGSGISLDRVVLPAPL